MTATKIQKLFARCKARLAIGRAVKAPEDGNVRWGFLLRNHGQAQSSACPASLQPIKHRRVNPPMPPKGRAADKCHVTPGQRPGGLCRPGPSRKYDSRRQRPGGVARLPLRSVGVAKARRKRLRRDTMKAVWLLAKGIPPHPSTTTGRGPVKNPARCTRDLQAPAMRHLTPPVML